MATTEPSVFYHGRRTVDQIFDDLDTYLDFCRFELRDYNPAELYRRDSANYTAYLASKRPRKPYLGNNPRNKKYQTA
jgi:hypothetical protein